MEGFDLKKFKADPSSDYLKESKVRKVDWLALSEYIGVVVKSYWPKQKLIDTVVPVLVSSGLVSDEAYDLVTSDSKSDDDAELERVKLQIKHKELEIEAVRSKEREKALEVDRLKLENDRIRFEKEAELDKLRLEKETDLELKKLEDRGKEREDREKEREDREKERLFQQEILNKTGQLPTASSPGPNRISNKDDFDLVKQQRALPTFDENEPDEFFQLFEKVAINLKWPKTQWPSLVQTALIGKGRTKYLSLSIAQCQDYEIVKAEILKAYEVTAEFYHAKFRQCRKDQNMSFTDFGHVICKYLNKWLTAAKVSTFEELREASCLEQFLSGIPYEIRVYIREREVTTLSKAATLAEDFCILKKMYNNSSATKQSHSNKGNWSKNYNHTNNKGNAPEIKSGSDNSDKQNQSGSNPGSNKPVLRCFFCHKPGHVFNKCPERKDSKKSYVSTQVADASRFATTSEHNETKKSYKVSVAKNSEVKTELRGVPFENFQFPGLVAGTESDKGLPVVIQRDTASNQSIVLRSAVPDIERFFTGNNVLLAGVGGSVSLPLCRLFVRSDLVTGYVDFAVEDNLVIDNVHILLGNEVSGDKVIPDPVVCPVPVKDVGIVELERKNPYLFPSCATTRSQAQSHPVNTNDGTVSHVVNDSDVHVHNDTVADIDDLGEDLMLLFETEELTCTDDVPITRELLLTLQGNDRSIADLMYRAVSYDEVSQIPQCYYLKNGLLMRKFRRHDVPSDVSWGEYHQIVVPTPLRSQLVSLAHNLGHLGVKKTLAKLMKYFFWPRISNDVAKFIRECHACQLAGKGNVKRVPLIPIKVTSEPFEKIVIDCVGPLPRSKKGNEYLLTIMDSVTRYPEAFPIRSIHSKVIVSKLVEFFTKFGFPKVIQSDQGSNFTSKVFQQALKEMGIKQQLSSVYHPESQGVLERFHSTLKKMLTKFCAT